MLRILVLALALLPMGACVKKSMETENPLERVVLALDEAAPRARRSVITVVELLAVYDPELSERIAMEAPRLFDELQTAKHMMAVALRQGSIVNWRDAVSRFSQFRVQFRELWMLVPIEYRAGLDLVLLGIDVLFPEGERLDAPIDIQVARYDYLGKYAEELRKAHERAKG